MNFPSQPTTVKSEWATCRFLSCSVLPVRFACNLSCPFCFSKSSISSLKHDQIDWQSCDIDGYYTFARERGATRLVITGGGEPLLRANDVEFLIRKGRDHFDEIACFTNGTYLTRSLADRLREAGLSYICFSRHSESDKECRDLMGGSIPTLERFFRAANNLKVRATCVMTKGYVDTREKVWKYINRLSDWGVNEFTFKHTYLAYDESVFKSSEQNDWSRNHHVAFDPFQNRGALLGRLPWGPEVRIIDGKQVCYYREPTPNWEKENHICRSINLLSNGMVYASLEDDQSLLFQLAR